MLAFNLSLSFADNEGAIDTPRFTLYVQHSQSNEKSNLAVKDLSARAISTLERTYEELSRILKVTPQQKVVLRFLPQEEFSRATGAPGWTNAMYFRGEITMPLNDGARLGGKELDRALRHEYVHAVVAEISTQRCPAWLDEGLAQLIEGKPNSLLGPALREWIAANDAIPFEWLESGFTTLSYDVVPAAYAQSLFATRTLVNRHGFSAITKYLQFLARGESTDEAFQLAFRTNIQDFERQLTKQIKRWSTSEQNQP
jgi:hypothetical protein